MVQASGQANSQGKLIPFHLRQSPGKLLNPAQLNQTLDAELFAKTNEVRQGKKLRALQQDPVLAQVAAAHSKDMLARDYLSHISPEGKAPIDRLKAVSSLRYVALGENLHTIKSTQGFSDPAAIANLMMQDWMGSKAHRKNILGKNFTRLGVGCASNAKRVYCTQVFGHR